MATKPATSPRLWGTTGVYTTGPFVGSDSIKDPGVGIAAEGHRPGNLYPTTAEHENYQQRCVTSYVASWLALGSSAGAADAHIVETDATGRARVQGLSVIDAIDETAVVLTSSSTFSPAVQISCSTGATVVSVNMGTASVIGVSCDVTTGAGTGFRSNLTNSPSGARGFFAALATAAAGSFGVDVTADGASAGGGIRSSHAGVNYAIEAISTGLLAALNVTATAASTTAAFIAGGSTRALSVTSDTTAASDAIHATTNNNTGFGVRAYVPASATSAARGFYTSVAGDAIGAEFVATGGYALKLTGDTTSPVFAPLFLTTANAKPTGFTDGQIAHVTPGGVISPYYAMSSNADAVDGGWRIGWDTVGGFCYGAVYGQTASNDNPLSYTTMAVVELLGANAPRVQGRILRISVTFRIRARDGVAGTCDVLLYDNTAGATIVEYDGVGSTSDKGWAFASTSDWSTTVSFEYGYAVPLAGTREIILRIRAATAAGLDTHGSMVITGAY